MMDFIAERGLSLPPRVTRIANEPSETRSPDSIQNYYIYRETGRGGTAIVYAATCLRGRLRNRVVALKKMNMLSGQNALPPSAPHKSSTKVHQSLCHPSIVSLLSTFDEDNAHYHVLEYCSNGTLEDRLRATDSRTLCEPELRGALKGIAEGLRYLQRELVIHRDIKPSNILLDKDWCVKIGDFGLAVRLSSETSTVTTCCGTVQYRSPQVLVKQPYGLETDIWSLGILMVTCLTGQPPLFPQVFLQSRGLAYTLPYKSSPELRDLVPRLLDIDRFTRIELSELQSHPFLSNEFFTKPLYYGTPDFPIQQLPAPPISRPPGRGPPSIVSQRYPPYLSKVEPPKGVFNILGPAPLQKTAQPSRNFLSDNWKPQADAHVLGRRIVSLPPASSSSFTSLKLEDRKTRQTTPPGSRALDYTADIPAGTDDSALVVPSHLGSGSGSNSGYNAGSDDSDFQARGSDAVSGLRLPRSFGASITVGMARQRTRNVEEGTREGPPLRYAGLESSGSLDYDSNPADRPPPRDARAGELDHPGTKRLSAGLPADTTDEGQTDSSGSLYTQAEPAISQPKPSESVHTDQPQTGPNQHNTDVAAVGHSERPVRFTTDYLTVQTHKVLKGQITVLPSKSLLVDLREGERRRGRKGDEVLVVSPDGEEIKVYSAPHLSTACCLAEPHATYDLGSLPKTYWGQYADAGRAANQLKSRIPKLVLYKPTAQCILMANAPYGDIEIITPPPVKTPLNARPSSADPTKAPTTRMKIRLRQDKRVIEISRYVSRKDAKDAAPVAVGTSPGPVAGQEWAKRILPVLCAGYQPLRFDEGSEASMDGPEKGAMEVLREFLGICRALEGSVCDEQAGKVDEDQDGSDRGSQSDSGSGSSSGSSTDRPYPRMRWRVAGRPNAGTSTGGFRDAGFGLPVRASGSAPSILAGAGGAGSTEDAGTGS
ncbi:kinase-like protein [Trametopsis cervina]|nr:kinase-like protein [Trametopsis cervina]